MLQLFCAINPNERSWYLEKDNKKIFEVPCSPYKVLGQWISRVNCILASLEYAS